MRNWRSLKRQKRSIQEIGKKIIKTGKTGIMETKERSALRRKVWSRISNPSEALGSNTLSAAVPGVVLSYKLFYR